MYTRVKDGFTQRQVSAKIDVDDWTSTAKVYADIVSASEGLEDWHIDLETDEDYNGINAGLVITGWRNATKGELRQERAIEETRNRMKEMHVKAELARTRERFPELFK